MHSLYFLTNMAFKKIQFTSTTQGNIPEEIEPNIMDTKIYLERIKKTKKSLNVFKNYYAQFKYKLPDDWTVNAFQDFINIFVPIYENKDLMNEPWFKEHHKMLFRDFLFEFRQVFGEYIARQLGKGHDDFVYNVIKTVNQQLINRLEEMKKNVSNTM